MELKESLNQLNLLELPPEILLSILSKIENYKTVLQIRLTCRRLYQLSVENHHLLPQYSCYRLVFGSTKILSDYYNSKNKLESGSENHSAPESTPDCSLGKRLFHRVFSHRNLEIDNAACASEDDCLPCSKVRLVPSVSRSQERHYYVDTLKAAAGECVLVPNLKHIRAECVLIEHEWITGINGLLAELRTLRQLSPKNVTLRYAECNQLGEAQLLALMTTFRKSIENLKLFSLIGEEKKNTVTDDVIMAAGDLRRLTISERVTHKVTAQSLGHCLLYPRITDRLLYHLANQPEGCIQFEMVNLFSCNIRNEGVVALIQSWDRAAKMGRRTSASIVLNSCPVDKPNILRLCEELGVTGIKDHGATFGAPSSGGSLVLHSPSNNSSLHVYYYNDTPVFVENDNNDDAQNQNELVNNIDVGPALGVRRKLGMRFDS